MAGNEHESVDRYIAAREAGDDATCQRIVAEVNARFNTRTTDGTEITELMKASLAVPLADPR